MIPDCMVTDRKTSRNRGPARDLWDDGYVALTEPEPPEQPFKLLTVLTLVVVLLGAEWLLRKLLRLA